MGEGETGAQSFGAFVRHRREALRMTLAEVSEQVECAKSYLSTIENEVRPAPSDEILLKLERVLRLPPGRLVEVARWERSLAAGGPAVRREVAKLREDRETLERLAKLLKMRSPSGKTGLDAAYESGELHRLVERVSPKEGNGMAMIPLADAREVPLINKVAAGYPREFTDLSYPARVADEYVRCPGLADVDAFAARVVGDSMEPNYVEGDIVVFSPAKPISDGMDCFARLEVDGQTTFKRVYFEEGGALIRLQPLNSAYPPRTFKRDEVAGLYAAVSVIKRIG